MTSLLRFDTVDPFSSALDQPSKDSWAPSLSKTTQPFLPESSFPMSMYPEGPSVLAPAPISPLSTTSTPPLLSPSQEQATWSSAWTANQLTLSNTPVTSDPRSPSPASKPSVPKASPPTSNSNKSKKSKKGPLPRNFACHICGAAFARNHDLRRHCVIHNATKPHSCPTCKKQFSRKDALNRHLTVKTGCLHARRVPSLNSLNQLSVAPHYDQPAYFAPVPAGPQARLSTHFDLGPLDQVPSDPSPPLFHQPPPMGRLSSTSTSSLPSLPSERLPGSTPVLGLGPPSCGTQPQPVFMSLPAPLSGPASQPQPAPPPQAPQATNTNFPEMSLFGPAGTAPLFEQPVFGSLPAPPTQAQADALFLPFQPW